MVKVNETHGKNDVKTKEDMGEKKVVKKDTRDSINLLKFIKKMTQ